MKYINYEKADCNNGEGFRVVLWLSQCSHGCAGCFNKNSWGNVGTVVDESFVQKILSDLDKPYIEGLTLSGGDPLHKRNLSEVITLCSRIKATLPEKDITLFTGYTYSEIVNDLLRLPILKEIDTLVDGKFVKELSPTSKPFRGSANQVIHTLSEGLSISQS